MSLQTVELKVTSILHLGQIADGAKAYPLAKKKQSMEFLREKMHLRARCGLLFSRETSYIAVWYVSFGLCTSLCSEAKIGAFS